MARRARANPLLADLRFYDGTSVAVLEQIASAHRDDPRYLDLVFEAATAEPMDADHAPRSGAIWLLRNAHRQGAAFPPAQVKRLVALIPLLTHWEQALNLLQILDAVPIPANNRRAVLAFAESSASDANTLVRAWAISVLLKVGRTLNAERDRIDQIADEALRTDKASVRARIRRAREEIRRASGLPPLP
ncbi:MAG: hypothetical protein KDA05_07205 [Phycisphaerales bacterium]|nr:hypothetical protein [Phycisphaerales bacterium]MCB9840852.1 hypothetical protein [Phycisphaeraceae bacterium]